MFQMAMSQNQNYETMKSTFLILLDHMNMI